MTATRRVHTHSIRLANGDEALVTRVLAEGGRVGYGFSMTLDATESRHMAEADAGMRKAKKIDWPAEIRRLLAAIRWEEQ